MKPRTIYQNICVSKFLTAADIVSDIVTRIIDMMLYEWFLCTYLSFQLEVCRTDCNSLSFLIWSLNKSEFSSIILGLIWLDEVAYVFNVSSE